MNTPVDTQVGGMTCGNCALTITNYLSKEGIKDAVANPVTGQLTFSIEDPERIAQLYAGIEKLGYTVHAKNQAGKLEDTHKQDGLKGLSLKYMWLLSLACWIPLMAHMFIAWPLLHNPWVQFFLCLPVYGLGFIHFGRSAIRSVRNGIPNMDVLIFIGSSAAFFYSVAGWMLYPTHVHHYLFFETCASIITLIFTGQVLEEYTMKQTGASMTALLQFREVKARIVFTDSIGKESIQEIDNRFLRVNDIVQVNTGDRVPADGLIVSGQGLFDESMMTGESLPVSKTLDSIVIGGTLLSEGAIRMKVNAVGDATALSRIIQLVNEAQAAKSPLQRLADKISAIFVPVVLVIAGITFALAYWAFHIPFNESIMRAVAVLVVACPCAMGLATPAAVMVGMGRAARMGILMKGGDTLQKCRDVKTIVFDKTGTLTQGQLHVANWYSDLPEAVFKSIVTSLEVHSSHPIAKALVSTWPAHSPIHWKEIIEEKGHGIQALSAEGLTWKIGSKRWIMGMESAIDEHDLYLSRNGDCVGWIDLQDTLREGVPNLIDQLHRSGYKTVLLSGDRLSKCERVAQEAGIQVVYGDCLPHEKLEKLNALSKEQPVAMVGDGINDAPALAAAHVGISLSDATQIALQNAGVVLINNSLPTLPLALGIGKHTYITIKQNLFWAFFYNVISIPVAASGFLTPGWGAAIMGLSDVILILNSLRLRYKKLA